MPAQKINPFPQQADRDFVSFIKDVSLFQDIRDEPGALSDLAKRLEVREFQPGQAIIKEGETGSELFLLVDGQASVYKSTAEGEEYRVAILHSSDHVFFGEGGLLDS